LTDDAITPIYGLKLLDQTNKTNQIFLFYKFYLKSYIVGQIFLKWPDGTSGKTSASKWCYGV